jgi:hypothetical protein
MSTAIKIQYGQDIRRVPINTLNANFNSFLETIKSMFNQINNWANLSLKYEDNDGDLVSISNTEVL